MGQIPRVHLVGAGPGDPDLLTLRAARLISRAQILVHDRLVSPEVLALAPANARLIPVGKTAGSHPVPQERINAMLVELALTGARLVRLKGGDPFIFGRGGEEAEALRAAGIVAEIVPGITAAQGAAASLGLPLTQRGLVTGLRYVTGHCRGDRPLELDWPSLADVETTLVIYMGAATIAEIAARLIEHGMPAELPVLGVSSATTAHARHFTSTLATVAEDAAGAALASPALFVIGRVVALLPAAAVVKEAVAQLPMREALHA